MPKPIIKKKAANLENSTPLFRAYLGLKKQSEFREAYREYFGFTERTLYNRMTATGIADCSEAEKVWFCDYFVMPRKKLFPETQKQAAWHNHYKEPAPQSWFAC